MLITGFLLKAFTMFKTKRLSQTLRIKKLLIRRCLRTTHPEDLNLRSIKPMVESVFLHHASNHQKYHSLGQSFSRKG